MALLTITINNASPSFDKKCAEAAYAAYCASEIMKDFGRNFESSGSNASVLGLGNNGTPNTAIGSWTYTAVATNP
jgi:hypothetical protein